MSNTPTLVWVVIALLALMVLLPAVYMVVRVAALAWFGTKREQAHKLVQELQTNERTDGNEDPKAKRPGPQRQQQPQRP
jgi:Na+/melibiose symporter-like transporter